MTSSRASALSRAAPTLAGALLALPILVFRYPPMTDLPLHEGMVALLRHFGDPAWAPPGLYVLNLGHANQLVYLLATPLAFVVSVETACKLIVALAIVLTVAGAGRLAAHVHTTPWSAVAIAPIVLGWTFYWGFVPNMLGLAGLLWALPTIDLACQVPSVRRAMGASGIAVLVMSAHEASALALAIVVAVFSLLQGVDRKTPLRIAPAAVVVALSAIEVVRERAVTTPLADLLGSKIAFHPFATKLDCFASFLVGAHGPAIEVALLAPALGLAAYGIALHAKRPRAGLETWRERWLRARFEIVAMALLVVYFVAPASVNFGAFLYQRFLPPAFIVAVVAVAPRSAHRLAALLAAVAPVGALFVVLPEMASASAEQRDLETLYPRIERASAALVFHVGGVGEPTLYSQASAGNRLLAERGGRLGFAFTEYPISPLVIPRGEQWNEAVVRLYTAPTSLEGRKPKADPMAKRTPGIPGPTHLSRTVRYVTTCGPNWHGFGRNASAPALPARIALVAANSGPIIKIGSSYVRSSERSRRTTRSPSMPSSAKSTTRPAGKNLNVLSIASAPSTASMIRKPFRAR